MTRKRILAGALVASIVAFVATGPAPASAELSPMAIGRCGSHFVRVDVVPSYHHEVYK